MRRQEDVQARAAPPFRVLEAPDYLTPPSSYGYRGATSQAPPPPRAPEPYKVAPASTAYARAHRRSSFVILADASLNETGEPVRRSPSPGTGRVSPFRGRGFKGPPPRSRSRIQSPENGHRGTGVVSHQGSPRRSLIPQPTRRRSISLSKNDRSPSPRQNRRLDSKYRLSVSSGNVNIANDLSSRRQISRSIGKLSPIQGTPTKPAERPKAQSFRREPVKVTPRASPTKTPRKMTTSPPKSVSNVRKKTNDRAVVRERVTSPSKIPMKKTPSSRKLAPPPSVSNTRFINMKPAKEQHERIIDPNTVNGVQSNGTREEESGSKENTENSSSGGKEDMALLDLLKQSSNATGTSSVVNTTTTTAVQPLQIDAKESSKNVEKRDGRVNGDSKITSESMTPVRTSQTNTKKTDEKSGSKLPRASSRSKNMMDNGVESPSDSVVMVTHSIPQPKNLNRLNGGSMNSPGQRSVSRSSLMADQGNLKASNPNLSKVADVASVSSSTVSSVVEGSKTENEVRDEPGRIEAQEMSKGAVDKVIKVASKENDSATSKMESPNVTNDRVDSVAKIESEDVTKEGNPGVRRMTNGNRGSNASLKSSTGISSGSAGSGGSTDTGVSVDTVRGVSSPREKTGIHVVKRSQEIETLSGNVTHLEHNGEPANGNEQEQTQNQKLIARWKKSWERYGKCCPGMRCLACRRDPKGFLWPRNKPRETTQASENAPPGCWSKFRTRFKAPFNLKCSGLKNMKCCARKARVAPAESQSCCPPERRFGALCRRLFSKCSCNCGRGDSQRRKSVRAKHSLTSVAPPPLSEEPKAKIPDVLVEHNSLMRGAIPCLPVPLAWFCLVWNVLLPGSGTFWSGLFNLCVGQPRFSQVASFRSRFGAFIVDLIVGIGQLFTVLFCLVGWGWSIWWGVMMIRLARKYKRFKDSEAANGDPEARGGEPAALPPGVPSQALREMERAR